MKWLVAMGATLQLSGCGDLTQAVGDEQGTAADESGPPAGDTSAASRPGSDTGADDGTSSSTTAEPPDLDTTSAVQPTSGPSESTGDAASSDDAGSGSSGDESSGAPPSPVCGDGRLDPGEACDDGQGSELDGCTSACAIGPVGISFGAVTTTSAAGGSDGNVGSSIDDCPEGQALTGLTGDLTSTGLGSAVVLGRIRGECGTVSLVDADPTSVATGPGAQLPLRGGFTGGGSYSLECPPGTVIRALEGHAGSIIDQMTVACVSLDVVGAGATQNLELGPEEDDGPAGGNGGSPWGPVACGTGQIATGLDLDTNSYVVRVALRCREVTLAFP